MKKTLAWILALLFILGGLMTAASADQDYLIPDSNTRRLTEEELWQWDYESLGYIYNEIFARHGYIFTSGGKYDTYFRTKHWYHPGVKNGSYSKIEWDNKDLIKMVRQDMRDMKTTNPSGRSMWNLVTSYFEKLQGFEDLEFSNNNQTLNVFSAPDASSWRGANGKAKVSTNGEVAAAGMESGWLLMMYETNTGIRVGYINPSKIKGNVTGDNYYRQLSFEYSAATVATSCTLTDDPIRQSSAITHLQPGDAVTYLTTFYGSGAWDYVEVRLSDGTVARGFVPSSALDNGTVDGALDDNIDVTEDDVG